MRLTIAIALLTISNGSLCQEKTHKPPFSEPPKLELKFKDDFRIDSRGHYEIGGKEDSVTWKEGKLTLGDGAILQRKLNAGPWVEMELDLEFPDLKEDGQTSELKIWLDLEDATDSFVCFQQKREKGKTRSVIFIVDTDGEWDQHTEQQPITKPLIVNGALANGKWLVKYRRGLWSVINERAGWEVHGYITNGDAFAVRLVLQSVDRATQVCLLRSSQSNRVTFTPSREIAAKIKEAATLNGKALRLYQSGKSAQAILVAQPIAEIRQSLLGYFHPDYATSLNNLAAFHESMGSYEIAEPLFIEARNIRAKVLGKLHPGYATSLNNLAMLYKLMGSYEKAEPLCIEARNIREKVLGKLHPSYANSLNNLATIYWKMGSYDKAEPLYLANQDIQKKTLGTQHPDYARSLNNLAVLYRSMGSYDKAESLYLEVRDIQKKTLGTQHPDYATSLNNLAMLYKLMGSYVKVEPLYLEVRDIQKKTLGTQHPDYARSLNNLAVLYRSMGSYDKAESLYLEVRDIQKKTLGTQHPDYATTLHNLAQLYTKMGSYEKAEPLSIRSLYFAKTVFGKEHLNYGIGLSILASLYRDTGRYGKAEAMFLEAKVVIEKMVGKEHPDYASILRSLAVLYEKIGNYGKAELLYWEALKICEKSLGKHPNYPSTLMDLGAFYRVMGDFVKAEPLCKKSLEIQEKMFGKENPIYASGLHNLAALYVSIGEHGRAELLYLRALKIQEKILGKQHPSYATGLHNLGALYRITGRFENAEALFMEAKVVRGKEHPDYADSLNSLGVLYSSIGDNEKSESLYRQALAIREEVVGVEHPDYANALGNLASHYFEIGNFQKAESLYLSALEIEKKKLRNDHPSYATSLSNLASTYQHMGRHEEAELPFVQSLEIVRSNLERFSIIQGESTQREFAKSFEYRFSNFVSNAFQLKNRGESVWKQALRWKGISLVRKKRNLVLSNLPETRDLFGELTEARSQLSKHLQGNPSAKGWHERKERLTNREEAATKELARKIKDLQLQLPDQSTQEFQLPQGSCLIDFRKFNNLTSNKRKPGKFLAKRQHYFALIRKSDDSVQMLDLGPAAKIEDAITRWRRPIESANANRRSIDLIGQQAMDHAGQELRQLLWAPLEKHIGDSELVIVSPDGALGRLPLIALPGKKPGTYLLEEKKIVYVPVPALMPQMLAKPETVLDRSSKPLLVGNVSYGEKPNQKDPDLLSYLNRRILKALQFGPLAKSAIEIDGIQKLFANATQLSEKNATEQAFQEQLKDHQILHIATHGFFQSPDSFMKTLPRDNQESFVAFQEQAKVLTENPNLLSGLAFANANAAASKTIDDAGEDGILYSAEIAMMPMENIELAVLSACETSLGTDDNPGEGLIGIQRAFQVAGVKSTIASYWKVDDRATQMLMNRFYKNLITEKRKAKTAGNDQNSTSVRIDALIDAQRWMLRELNKDEVAKLTPRGVDDKTPVEDIKIKKSSDPKSTQTEYISHPRYWAAFVLSGDWR